MYHRTDFQFQGWNKLKCIHLNDSKTDLGGRSDRHQNIGRGKMTLYPFWRIMNDERFKNIPKILETPVAVPTDEEIKFVLSLVGKEEPPLPPSTHEANTTNSMKRKRGNKEITGM